MNLIKKCIRLFFLSVISSLPLGLISFAAKASRIDQLDLDRRIDLLNDIEQFRDTVTRQARILTIDEAQTRFWQQKKKFGTTQDLEFWLVLESLEAQGLIARDGEFIISMSPSII